MKVSPGICFCLSFSLHVCPSRLTQEALRNKVFDTTAPGHCGGWAHAHCFKAVGAGTVQIIRKVKTASAGSEGQEGQADGVVINVTVEHTGSGHAAVVPTPSPAAPAGPEAGAGGQFGITSEEDFIER